MISRRNIIKLFLIFLISFILIEKSFSSEAEKFVQLTVDRASDVLGDSSSKEEGKTIEKSDDPIRMYLREMGGVELLSREGEIAIAKRIEAGKDVMLNALSQSPITAQQFFEWNNKLQKDEILVREIIDIDTNYMEDENTGQASKTKKPVVGFIAGKTAPSGRRMGHAGAIISGGKGTASDKIEKMKSCGITIANSPAEIGKTLYNKVTG